jgi:outer membrane protein with beta-barrel domain
MSRSCLLLVLAALVTSFPLHAQQRTRFGFAIGQGLVAGDSRTLIDVNGDTATGAGQAGLHLRAFVEAPLGSPSFAFRGELFYNRLTASSNTIAIVNGSVGKEALRDETLGLMGSLIATSAPQARVSPYFLIGAGIVRSTLGTNPDPLGTEPSRNVGGYGLGLQVGTGLRWRLGRADLQFELRYNQVLNNTRGSAFWPLTVGITF